MHQASTVYLHRKWYPPTPFRGITFFAYIYIEDNIPQPPLGRIIFFAYIYLENYIPYLPPLERIKLSLIQMCTSIHITTIIIILLHTNLHFLPPPLPPPGCKMKNMLDPLLYTEVYGRKTSYQLQSDRQKPPGQKKTSRYWRSGSRSPQCREIRAPVQTCWEKKCTKLIHTKDDFKNRLLSFWGFSGICLKESFEHSSPSLRISFAAGKLSPWLIWRTLEHICSISVQG